MSILSTDVTTDHEVAPTGTTACAILERMATRQRLAKKQQDDGLRINETRSKLAAWLRENADHKPVASPGAPVDNALGLSFQHLVSQKPGHDAATCKACVIGQVLSRLQVHEGELEPWEELVPFVKETEAVAASLKTLAAHARARQESFRKRSEERRTAALGAGLAPEPRRYAAASDACERMARVLDYAREELAWAVERQRAEFASPDHMAIASANPPQLLIKEITRMLTRVGFTRHEIASLVVDRPNIAPPGTKDYQSAVGRVRSRLKSEDSETVDHPASTSRRPPRRRTDV